MHGLTTSLSGRVARPRASSRWFDGTNPNEVVVSLANYTAPSDWEYTLREPASDGGGATVQVNAGWSLLKLYSRSRPAGYTLPTQTALPSFQLGGVIANSVHGGTYAVRCPEPHHP